MPEHHRPHRRVGGGITQALVQLADERTDSALRLCGEFSVSRASGPPHSAGPGVFDKCVHR